MSFCNRRLTNRRICKRSILPYLWDRSALQAIFTAPFAGNPVMLYLAGAFTATVFEVTW